MSDILTEIVHAGHWDEDPTGTSSVPLFRGSTFSQHDPESHPRWDYGRSGNPTRAALEEAVAKLEGGCAGFAFASGIAAVNSVLLTLSMGDHVVVINAAKCVFTGKKNTTKMYRRTTTQPGSMVEVRADVMKKTFPSRIIESAVKGMLPKGPLGRAMYRKLKVYEGAEHQQTSQQPEPMTIKL